MLFWFFSFWLFSLTLFFYFLFSFITSCCFCLHICSYEVATTVYLHVLWQPLVTTTNSNTSNKSLSRISSGNHKRTQQGVPAILLPYLYKLHVVYATLLLHMPILMSMHCPYVYHVYCYKMRKCKQTLVRYI